MKIDTVLYRGFVNKNLMCVYNYNFEPNGQFQTIKTKQSGALLINPSFSITITEGHDKNRVFLPANRYYPFASLFNKTIKTVSENLFDIFPDLNNMEFEIDSRTLERFQTEKAMQTADITMMPAVWVNDTNQCFPAIKVSMTSSHCIIPLEDAIPMSKMLSSFEPHTFGLSMLRIIGKID